MALYENTERGPRAYARALLLVPFIRIFQGFGVNDDLQKAIGLVRGYLVAGVSGGARRGAARTGLRIAEPAPRVKREFARNPAERAAACSAGRVGKVWRERPATCDVRRPTFDNRDVGGRTSNVEVGARPSRAPRYFQFFSQCRFITSRRSVVSPSRMSRSLPVSASRMDSRFQP